MPKFSKIISFLLAFTLIFTSVDVDVYATENLDNSITNSTTEIVDEDSDIGEDDVVIEDESVGDPDDLNENSDGEENTVIAPEELQNEVDVSLEEEKTQLEGVEDEINLNILTAEPTEDEFIIEGSVLVEYKGEGGAIVIPEGVTEIGSNAFYGNTSITSVSFPSTLTTIGQYAFYNCTSITSIDMPASVATIKVMAFAVSEMSGTTALTIANKSISVGDNAFKNRTFNAVSLPSDMTTIPQKLFYNASFTGISIPIPDSVTSIGENAFANTKGLNTVTFTANSVLKKIGQNAFANSSISEIALPSSLTTISTNAFYNCKSLNDIVIPENVKSIENSAFAVEDGTNTLTAVTVNGSSISAPVDGYGMEILGIFNGRVINSVSLPSNLTVVPQLFSNTTFSDGYIVSIPSSVTAIGAYSFAHTKGLKGVSFHGGKIERIGTCAFWDSSISDVAFPTSLKAIGLQAFMDCPNLTEIIIPENVESVSYKTFALDSEDSISNSKRTTISIYSQKLSGASSVFANRTVESVSLPEGITKLPSVFSEMGFVSGYTLEIPSTVTSIDSGLFYATKGLKSVSFSGKNLSSVGDLAFAQSNISQITLPESVTSIGKNAFTGCNSLKSVTLGSGITSMGATPFNGADIATFYVVSASSATYKNLVSHGINENRIVVSNKITVTFDAGEYGELVNTAYKTRTINVGDQIGTLPEVEVNDEYKNTKKILDGCWYTADGELVTETTKMTGTTDVTLYAKYQSIKAAVENPTIGIWGDEDLVGYVGDKLYIRCSTDNAQINYCLKYAESDPVSDEDFTIVKESGTEYTGTIKLSKPGYYEVIATATVGEETSEETTAIIEIQEEVAESDLYEEEYSEGFWMTYNGAKYDAENVNVPYTGNNVSLSGYEVYYGKVKLTEGTDYRVSYKNNKNVANYNSVNAKGQLIAPTVTITGLKSYKGSFVEHFSIIKREDAIKLVAHNLTVEAADASPLVYEYTGAEIRPEVIVYWDDPTTKKVVEKTIIPEENYTVSYSNNINASKKATITITFDGISYWGIKTQTFTINKKNIVDDDGNLQLDIEKNGDNGTVFKETAINKYGIAFTLKYNDVLLREKADYSTAFKSTLKNGVYTNQLIITGKGNYQGKYTISDTFDAKKIDIATAKVYPCTTSQLKSYNKQSEGVIEPVYTGKANNYKPVNYTLVDSFGNIIAASNYSIINYEVDEKNTGEYTKVDTRKIYSSSATFKLTIKAKDNNKNYEGTKSVIYNYNDGYTFDEDSITTNLPEYVVWKNSAKNYPTFVLKDIRNNQTLKLNKDYTVKYTYADDEIVVPGKNGKKTYSNVRTSGEAVGQYDIVPAGAIINVTVVGQGNYENKEITKQYRVGYNINSTSVKVGTTTFSTSNKANLLDESDLIVKYKNTQISKYKSNAVVNTSCYNITNLTNNSKSGRATFTLQGQGEFVGTKKVTYTINQKNIAYSVEYEADTTALDGTQLKVTGKTALKTGDTNRFTLSSCGFTAVDVNNSKNKYVFQGWYDDQGKRIGDALTTVVATKNTKAILPGETATYTAKFIKANSNAKVTIQFEAGADATGKMAARQVAQGKILTLPGNAFKKQGYEFVEWKVKEATTTLTDGATSYANSQKIYNCEPEAKTITLVAQWREK